jgi:3-hydroxybutyryl-CoA dehydrogenase
MIATQRIGVVGAGQMGSGFALVCAQAGLDVSVACRSQASASRAGQRLGQTLAALVRKEKMTAGDSREVAGRVRFSVGLHGLRDCRLILESIPERLPDKRVLFAELDEAIEDPQAILASNTSSLPLARIASATGAPDRVIGVHFFNPVPVMPLVEVISTLRTSQQVVTETSAFVTDVLGKHVIYAKDRAGFVVNSLLVPFLLQAVRMLDAGVASAKDIDDGMRLGCGHPMGPLALIDLIGLDTVAAVGDAMFQETKEPMYAPPPLLLRMVETGLLGRKAGAGFHVYDSPQEADRRRPNDHLLADPAPGPGADRPRGLSARRRPEARPSLSPGRRPGTPSTGPSIDRADRAQSRLARCTAMPCSTARVPKGPAVFPPSAIYDSMLATKASRALARSARKILASSLSAWSSIIMKRIRCNPRSFATVAGATGRRSHCWCAARPSSVALYSRWGRPPAGTVSSTDSSPRLTSRRSAGYRAPGLGWYTMAGVVLKMRFSPYPECASRAMYPRSTCSKSVSERGSRVTIQKPSSYESIRHLH